MKTAELHKLDDEQLDKKLHEGREELMKLRFQHAVAGLENTARLGQVKRDVARILTVRTERRKGIVQAGAGSE